MASENIEKSVRCPKHPKYKNLYTYVWRVSWPDNILSASSHTVVVDDSWEFVFALRLKPFNKTDVGSGLRRLPVADITCQLPLIDENDSFLGRFLAFIGTETGLVLFLEWERRNCWEKKTKIKLLRFMPCYVYLAKQDVEIVLLLPFWTSTPDKLPLLSWLIRKPLFLQQQRTYTVSLLLYL